MKISIEFSSLWEDEKRDSSYESISERVKMDYPDMVVNLTKDPEEEYIVLCEGEFDAVDDVDIFLCEEICHEYELYCYIYTDSIRKEFYYDESEDWNYKKLK
jgi:hypothetical protein|tara:strand:+ start:1139 stop:1444 length:306 start_codon:yes stop_codon:yes gene_type:complete